MRFPGKIDKVIAVIVCAAFFLQSFSQSNGYAQELVLPIPGTMVDLSVPAVPAMLKGIKVHPENPFRLDFILDRGSETSSAVKRESNLAKEDYLKEESTKIIKYFLAALTTPEKDLWVNLSPYEKDRIVPESFGQTEMGRDLLAQDYLLKQITASLVYPEGDLGKQFWKRVYELTANKNVPINTFNKVWIVPDKAVVYENAKNGTAYVVESSLKVLTEQDYLALDKNAAGGAQAVRFARSLRGTMALSPATPRGDGLSEDERNSWATGPAHAIRDLVIPQLTKEVNTGANFAQLRQVYNSLILATWYKKKIQDNIIAQVYADKNKIKGTEFDDPLSTRTIYERYLQAFKKGTYNFIKEEKDPVSQQVIPRKYFSGGWSGHVDLNVVTNPDAAMTNSMLSDKRLMRINLILQSSTQDPAMQSLREKHFVKRFIRVSGRNVRISEIFNVPLTPQEEQVVIDKIQRDPNFKAVLLKEDVLKDALAKKHGRIQLVLNEDAGIIPKNHLGSTVTLGVSVGALMTDEDPIDWKSLSEKNIVRVNPTGYLFIKVRGHYLLTFNQGALNEGELLLSPPGGGYWFADKDGRQLFYQHMALSRSLDRDEPLSMRRIISGRDLELFVTMFDSTQGREAAPYRELVQELVGPHSETGGVFDHVPVSWQNTVAKIVDAAQIVEAGKKLSKIDGDRGNYSFNVLEYEYLLSDEFKGLRDEIIRWGYFYWESFRFTNPMILAFDGTELVGALKASYKDRKTVVGTGITVKPDHRGRGVGIRLFIHMTEFLKSKGIDVYRIKFENTQEAQGVARYVETVFAGNVQVVKDAGGNITEVSISPRLFDAPKAMSLLKSGDPVDAGMTAPGGIDLNADNLTLQTKSQGGQIKFHADPALLARFKDAPGLMPVIMNIQPLDDLKVFLGL